MDTRRSERELLASLPSSELKQEFSSAYVEPFKFRQIPAGQRHYYNFTITPEFERATSLYLNGRAEEAIEQIERILADEKNTPTLLWQAAYLKVNALVIMGRPDDAERETVRLERLEIAAMGKNHTTRALRSEVKYWAGDIEGALEDAAQVVSAFGDWRYIAAYSTPPLDQVELARCVTAQVRATIVLGMSLLARGRAREALPWLELSNQTMNNVMYTSRHPINSLYFQPPEEIFWGRGMSLVALGTALLSLDPNSKRAEETFGRARDYFDALGFRAGPVLIEATKAYALLAAGNPARAEQQAGIGSALAEKLGLVDYLWRLEALRGKALIDLGRFAEAERSLRRAQSVVDLMAGTMASDDSKVRFGVGKEGITRDLINIDLRKNDLTQLFDDMERGRARAFVALLTNRVVAQDRGGALVDEVRALDRQIQQERQRKNALSVQGVVDTTLEQRLLDQRAGLVAKLRARDPDLADALSVSSVSIAAVRARLPENAIMVYAVPSFNDDPLNLLFISRQAVSLARLDINAARLKGLLDEFNAAITLRHEGRQRAALSSIRAGLALESWPKAGLAYFVPSGHTHFVPWGAIDVEIAVAVLPTGGWVARSPLSLPTSATAVIIGDPEFGGLLPQLPGALAEARSISDLYTSPALVGASATETALRGSIGRGVDVLHFATHALFDPVYPMQSSLIITDGKRAVPLTAEKLFAQPMSARLVILSACETGMGEVVSGDEILGLTRSFYLGGASSVVSSLWPVEDDATRLFMETFHAQSRNGDYGGAWLAARNAVRAKGFLPSAYGAFVLGGSLGQ
ncbi:MAG: CHAT domain-containing protein [Betaproteobacteria bacterium]|nr:CHAT domain-containing protein [Betaproteobacteria bacterium]